VHDILANAAIGLAVETRSRLDRVSLETRGIVEPEQQLAFERALIAPV
jgi:hypothetical protein